ncbi:ATPRB1, putative [Ricinus communis]|uniref:ATPRB1, putative n=1 Tax=Ricinus communis TaxID=3988 RepID=B9S7V1_RICCO|nr:ATPRB1, putative [Ricinus communis]
MKSVYNLPLAICLIGLALNVHVSLAQNSPQDYIDAHNAVRAEVRSRPLVWNETMAEVARNKSIERINCCNLIRIFSDVYYENIAEASYGITAVVGVKLWATERTSY